MRLFTGIVFTVALVTASAQDSISLTDGWVFQTDPEKTGVAENWMQADFDDSSWKQIAVGTRWEDHGYRDYNGVGWYRNRIDLPATGFLTNTTCLLLGGANDSCTIYCNGEEIDSYGDNSSRTMYDTPIIAVLGKRLKPGKNVIAIRVLDWGGNGGLWRAPVELRASTQSLGSLNLINFRADPLNNQLNVEFRAESFGNKALASPLPIALSQNARGVAMKQTVSPRGGALFTLESPAPEEVYTAEVALASNGETVPLTATYTWPAKNRWAGDYSQLEVLNNFVTKAAIPHDKPGEIAFLNPRHGWVFFSAPASAGALKATIDDETAPLVWRSNVRNGDVEAMRLLPEGKHLLRGIGDTKGVRVLSIPEIAFCYYPYTHHVKAFGAPNTEYMDKYVLSDVNTLVSRSQEIEKDPFFEQWQREGRQWLANGSVPGLKAPEPPDPKVVVDAWLTNRGVTDPRYGGLIVDEFTSETDAHYRAWTQAVQLLRDAPAMKNKQFYAWCVDLFRDQGPIEFSQKLKATDFIFSWEKYIREEAEADVAERWINQSMAQSLEEWQRAVPGIERNMIICLGYFSAPPETLDVDPSVDYNVFLDMQFHMMATDPRLFGLRGVMEYLSDYADEEYLRYAQLLFRHYCIEGKTERLNNDPYILPHVINPDFAKGLEGWDAEGAVKTNTMDGFSFLEGRYPRYKEGDQFCEMTRGEKPNRVTQKIVKLTPGRLYSLKMYSAQPSRLAQNEATGLGIGFEGVELLPEFTFNFVFPSSYAHEVPPYNRDNPAYMTFHRRVFRATSETAEIRLSDENAKAGAVTACNFVQIQPYHAP